MRTSIRDHLASAYERIEQAGERPPSRLTVPTLVTGRPFERAAWPHEPLQGQLDLVAGHPGAQVAWAMSLASAAIAADDPVRIAAPAPTLEWLTMVLLSHGGIPLARLEAGCLRTAEWPLLSRRMGRLLDCDIIMADDPAVVGSTLPEDGRAVVVTALHQTGELRSLARAVRETDATGYAILSGTLAPDLRLVRSDPDGVYAAGDPTEHRLDLAHLRVLDARA